MWGWQQPNSCGVLAETMGTQQCGQLLKCCSLSLKQAVRPLLLHHIQLLNPTTKQNCVAHSFQKPTSAVVGAGKFKSYKSQAGCLTTEQSQPTQGTLASAQLHQTAQSAHGTRALRARSTRRLLRLSLCRWDVWGLYVGADRGPGAVGEALPCAQVNGEGRRELGHAAAPCGDVDGGRVEGMQCAASCPLHSHCANRICREPVVNPSWAAAGVVRLPDASTTNPKNRQIRLF